MTVLSQRSGFRFPEMCYWFIITNAVDLLCSSPIFKQCNVILCKHLSYPLVVSFVGFPLKGRTLGEQFLYTLSQASAIPLSLLSTKTQQDASILSSMYKTATKGNRFQDNDASSDTKTTGLGYLGS